MTHNMSSLYQLQTHGIFYHVSHNLASFKTMLTNSGSSTFDKCINGIIIEAIMNEVKPAWSAEV